MGSMTVDDWLKQVAKREPVELGEVDRRLLKEMMKQPVMLEVWRKMIEAVEGQAERLKTLNTLDQGDAAEALRIQGTVTALVMLAETFWESMNV